MFSKCRKILFFVELILPATLVSAGTHAATKTVMWNGHSSLQKAIDGAGCPGPGEAPGTVIIPEGTYSVEVILNSPVKIIGAGVDKTTLKSITNSPHPLLTANALGVINVGPLSVCDPLGIHDLCADFIPPDTPEDNSLSTCQALCDALPTPFTVQGGYEVAGMTLEGDENSLFSTAIGGVGTGWSSGANIHDLKVEGFFINIGLFGSWNNHAYNIVAQGVNLGAGCEVGIAAAVATGPEGEPLFVEQYPDGHVIGNNIH